MKRVDFRWVTSEKLDRIRHLLQCFYVEKQMSTTEVARMIGKSQYATWSLYKRLGMVLRSPEVGGRLYAPKRTPHRRHPFAGSDLDLAYLRGFARGDLHAMRVSSLGVFVSSTTTHPAFVALFKSLFQRHGPVYVYPIYDEQCGHRWKLATRLDNSFSFLLSDKKGSLPESDTEEEFFAWLAGLVDSDGSVGIIHSGRYVRLRLTIANQDCVLLRHIKLALLHHGYRATGPYISYRKGDMTPARMIGYKSDMYCMSLQRSPEVRKILRDLPLRHGEKTRRKSLALSLPYAARWSEFGERVESLRDQIKEEVAASIRESEENYRATRNKGRGKALRDFPEPVVSF